MAPSQVEKVAQAAGKAAPAVAVVGALAAAAPQVHTVPSRQAAAAERVIPAHLDAVVLPARPGAATAPAQSGRDYTVRAKDTLSGIAERFYGRSADWHWLYQVNRSRIANPGLIYPGEVLKVPGHVSATFTAYSTDGDGDHDHDRSDAYKPRHARTGGSGGHYHGGVSGTLGCGGLESLWRSAGGAPWAEVTAASVAMAESSGNQWATGPFGERGYWQINPVNGALSTYDAYGNARAAVIMSHNGSDWSPWTTYTSGAYAGRC